MTYLYIYVVSSYIAWYVIMIRNEKMAPIGKLLFWFAPLLLPIVLLERFVIPRL